MNQTEKYGVHVTATNREFLNIFKTLNETRSTKGVAYAKAVVKNSEVKEGLIRCLENIKQQILQIPIQDQLKRSKLVRFELTPEEKIELKRQRQERLSGMNQNQDEEQPELNESLVNSIVQNILREIKK